MVVIPSGLIWAVVLVLAIVGAALLGGRVARAAAANRQNAAVPKHTEPVTVQSKRTEVARQAAGEGAARSYTSDYYVTFRARGGTLIELEVAGEEYARLTEGMRGSLTYRGSRYLGFTQEQGR